MNKQSKKIGLSVPVNFSKNFHKNLKSVIFSSDNYNYIDNVYGSPKYLTLGQSRASSKIPNISKTDMKSYIKELHSMKIKFHLTINAIWSNGYERNPNNRENILKEIDEFMEIGVDAFILGNLYLADFIKSRYPDLNIIASINLKTDSLYKFEHLISDFKFSKIVLERATNRNILFLKGLIKKNYSDKIILLANPDCLFDCPLSLYHMLENGHLSITRTTFTDKEYCITYCKNKFHDIKNILKTSWIHPQDLDLYKEIGIKYIKIQGRTLNQERIINITKAYLSEKTSNSNLLEIFPNFLGKANYIKKHDNVFKNFNRRKFVEDFFHKNINCKIDCEIKCQKCIQYANKLQRS